MIHPELLEILCCPETREPVREAPAALVAELNRAIRRGEVRNGRGSRVRAPISGALLREDGQFAYPVRNDIPIMLIEERLDVPPAFRPPPETEPAAGRSEEEIAAEGDAEHHEVESGTRT